MNSIQFLGALELGFIYTLVTLGVYLSFRIVQFPDLTVDGSFPLGAAISATLIIHGVNPYIATFIAVLAGACAGFMTAYLQVRWKILNLLSGILIMTALYSINLRIMGKPNIALLTEPTIFSLTGDPQHLLIMLGIIVLLACVLLYSFLNSQVGLALRGSGINPRISPTYGISIDTMTLVGLAFSNAFIAFAGALFAQANGFADISMGTGTLITGLASVIVGESLLKNTSIGFALCGCVIGSIFYRLVIAMALNTGTMGLRASDLNLVTATLVVLAMLMPRIRQKFFNHTRKKP